MPTSARERTALALFVVAVLIGLSLWVHLVNAAIPFVVDEVVYSWQAEHLAAGRLTSPEPAFPRFVWNGFLPTRDGQRFGMYPIGLPIALVPWVVAGIPWALNVFLAGVSLLLLYTFCRRLDGPLVAWIAVLLTALSPFFIVQSTITMSHPLTLVLTLWLLVSLERYRRSSRRTVAAIQAGAAIGYAINVSPLIAVPLALVCVERALTRPRGGAIPRRDVIGFLIPIVAGIALFCLVNQRTTGSPWVPGYYFAVSQRVGFGEKVGRGSHSPADALRNSWERLDLLDEYLFGWPIPSLSFACLYLVTLVIRRRISRSPASRAGPCPEPGASDRDRWNRPLLLLFVGTLTVYAFWYFAGTQKSLGPRFLYMTLPSLILFSARGIVGLALFVPDRSAPRNGVPRRGLVAMTIIVALLFLSGTAPYLERLARMSASRWRRAARSLLEELDRRGIERGTIFIESTMFNRLACLQYQSRFLTEAALVFVQDRGGRENAKLLLARSEMPVYYVEPDGANFRWVIHEAPAHERGGSTKSGSTKPDPVDEEMPEPR